MNRASRDRQDPGARNRLLAHVAMIGYTVLIAGSFSFGALAAPDLSPTVLNAVRFAAATLLMGGIFLVRNGGRIRIPRAPWRFLVLGALMGIYFILMFVALRLTDPVSTSAVFTMIPLLTAIFGYLILGQRTRGLVWTSLLIAAFGALWVVFRADITRAMTFRVGLGESIFFVGCACQALYAPMVRLLNRGESVFESSVWTIVGCTLVVTLFAMPQLGSADWTGVSRVSWLAIGYLAVFATAASFFLLQYGSMHLSAARVFPYGYLIPTFVIVIEAVLGHGLAPAIIIVGAGITTLGLIAMAFISDR